MSTLLISDAVYAQTLPISAEPVMTTFVGLPDPVARYIQYSRAHSRRPIRRLSLKQTGFYRLKPQGKWKPIQGQLELETTPFKRQWSGVIRQSVVLSLLARDSYADREAILHTERFSFLPTERAMGPEMDRSALAAILSELPLTPTALLPSRRLTWEAIDDTQARATLHDRDLQVSGIFHFDELGRIRLFQTDDRYRYHKHKIMQTPWSVAYRDYVEFGNVRIPMWLRATWLIDKRPFNYSDLKVTNVALQPSPITG
jgi:hypothetical protein